MFSSKSHSRLIIRSREGFQAHMMPMFDRYCSRLVVENGLEGSRSAPLHLERQKLEMATRTGSAGCRWQEENVVSVYLEVSPDNLAVGWLWRKHRGDTSEMIQEQKSRWEDGGAYAESGGRTDLGAERLRVLLSLPHVNEHNSVGCLLQNLRARCWDRNLGLRVNRKRVVIKSVTDWISQTSEENKTLEEPTNEPEMEGCLLYNHIYLLLVMVTNWKSH